MHQNLIAAAIEAERRKLADPDRFELAKAVSIRTALTFDQAWKLARFGPAFIQKVDGYARKHGWEMALQLALFELEASYET